MMANPFLVICSLYYIILSRIFSYQFCSKRASFAFFGQFTDFPLASWTKKPRPGAHLLYAEGVVTLSFHHHHDAGGGFVGCFCCVVGAAAPWLGDDEADD